MTTLRLLTTAAASPAQGNELLCCAYSPDNRFIVTGGWDGHLRLWDCVQGGALTGFQVSPKPVSACGITPDGKVIVSGSLEGMLARWNSETQRQISTFLPHTRPVSGLCFLPDGRMVTASWDKTLILWNGDKQEGKTFTGHTDIVAGARVSPDSKQMLSWAYDNTLRLWEIATSRLLATFNGHADRVLCAAASMDSQYVVSGSRDHALKLWDYATGNLLASLTLEDEVRACFLLLDMQTLISVEANGKLRVLALPGLHQTGELATGLPVQCADLAPSSDQIALACSDGRVHLVAIEGMMGEALAVAARQDLRVTQTTLQKLFGKTQQIFIYRVMCPVCRQEFEWPNHNPSQPASCPSCFRQLKIACVIPLV